MKYINKTLIYKSLIFITICIIIIIALQKPTFKSKVTKINSPLYEFKNVIITQLSTNEIQDKKTSQLTPKWKLLASNASINNDNSQLNLINIKSYFFFKNIDKLTLFANSGNYMFDSNEIKLDEITASLNINDQNFELISDKIIWNEKKKTIFSNSKTIFKSKNLELEGNYFKTTFPIEKIIIKNNSKIKINTN